MASPMVGSALACANPKLYMLRYVRGMMMGTTLLPCVYFQCCRGQSTKLSGRLSSGISELSMFFPCIAIWASAMYCRVWKAAMSCTKCCLASC